MSRREVAVTGAGLVSPAGIGLAENWRTLNAGVSVARRDPILAGLPVSFSCSVPEADWGGLLGHKVYRRADRFVMFALGAAREAVADAGLNTREWDHNRVAVVMGVGASSMERWQPEYDRLGTGQPQKVSPLALLRSLPSSVSAEVAMDLGAKGPNLAVSTACASGGSAIGLARDLLLSGACDIAIAGGSESTRSRMAATCFHQMRALSPGGDDVAAASRPFDVDRNGFVLGEGAGVLVLERAEHAEARGIRAHAYLCGFGASSDAGHPTQPDQDGDGAVRAMQTSVEDAGVAPGEVDHVNAHGTSTPLNDLTESRALRKVFGAPPPVTAVKSVIGHAVGGAGAIEAVISVLTLEKQTISPTVNLDCLDPEIDLDVVVGASRRTRLRYVMSNSFGFGGHNVALLFRAA